MFKVEQARAAQARYKERHPTRRGDAVARWNVAHPGLAKSRAAAWYYWAKENQPEKLAEANRRRVLAKYGMTPQDYEEMRKEQDDKCTICKKSPDYRLVVDHDHRTGKVRGLLCHGCNSLVSFLDIPGRVPAAIEYLERTDEIGLGGI